MPKTAIIYARVSTARQASDDLPVESQIERCITRAMELEATVLRVFKDEGVSGRKSDRKGWLAAMVYCETHQVDYFICWDTRRFARNYIAAGQKKAELIGNGTQLVYVSQSFDGKSGWMLEAMTTIFDEAFSRQVAEDTMRSMVKNAMDGFFNGGRVPYGFHTVSIGKRKKLEPDPVESVVLKMMYRWCMEGAGCKDIAVRLNNSGIMKRGRRWDKSSVSFALRSPAAVGKLSFKVSGEEIITESHQAIIDEEEFAAVQGLITARAPKNVGGRPRSEAVFSGILRCGECGDAMTTESATGRTGSRYRYYNCRAWLKGSGCRSRRIPVADLDDVLLGGILDKIFTPENMRDIVADLKGNNDSWHLDHQARLTVLRRELAETTRRLQRLYESIEAGTGLELRDVAPRIRELQAMKAATDQALSISEVETAPAIELTENDLDQAAELLRGMVASCDDKRKVRGFLAAFIRQIVLYADELKIEYFPDRIIDHESSSQCAVKWLPDLTTLRTAAVRLPAAMIDRRRAA